jgi:ABC-2 type transport system permease protein
MNAFLSAFWAEFLKARRSKVTPLTFAGFMLLPLVSGLFMIILKDPEAARSMGLISTKAQLVGGSADWPTHLGMLAMGTAIAGLMLFSIITAWVFGREFSDHTVKELLALPTPRGVIVGAKFVLIALWAMVISVIIFWIGIGVGALVNIPGGSAGLVWSSFRDVMLIAFLTYLLMPFVALIASVGRGYLPPLGWAFLTMVLAQIAGVLGWGDWFPWTVPGLLTDMTGPRTGPLGLHSYLVVVLAFAVGLAATFVWWRTADQAG